jgi:hypothetical protein
MARPILSESALALTCSGGFGFVALVGAVDLVGPTLVGVPAGTFVEVKAVVGVGVVFAAVVAFAAGPEISGVVSIADDEEGNCCCVVVEEDAPVVELSGKKVVVVGDLVISPLLVIFDAEVVVPSEDLFPPVVVVD